jgi:hypothetical protein
MIDRPLLREKIIDKMADAFLKLFLLARRVFGVLLSRELIFGRQWVPLSMRASMRSVWISDLRRAKSMPIRSEL